LDSKKIFTTELRKILMCKEKLLTDVKNMLYHHTDDVERLQKVIDDTEQQFASPTAFSRSRRWARRKGGGKRNWRFSGRPPRRSWIWWI
jgi:hypothetical protein